MKKIVLVLVAAMVLVFTGCEKKETISMPFDVADVNNIEMYRNAEPYSAEKQVITESEDIADLYSLFSGLEVSDKKTEPVVGETITSFRFNLSDDTSYEIIYCAEAVKSGRLKFPAEKLDYFTSADIEYPQMRIALLEGLCKFFESCRCPFPSWGAAPTVLHVTDLEDGLVK